MIRLIYSVAAAALLAGVVTIGYHARSGDDHRARSKTFCRLVCNARSLSEILSLPLEG